MRLGGEIDIVCVHECVCMHTHTIYSQIIPDNILPIFYPSGLNFHSL